MMKNLRITNRRKKRVTFEKVRGKVWELIHADLVIAARSLLTELCPPGPANIRNLPVSKYARFMRRADELLAAGKHDEKRAGALKWLGDRYLLAQPVKRKGDQKQ
jgi:hypothetical protein